MDGHALQGLSRVAEHLQRLIDEGRGHGHFEDVLERLMARMDAAQTAAHDHPAPAAGIDADALGLALGGDLGGLQDMRFAHVLPHVPGPATDLHFDDSGIL